MKKSIVWTTAAVAAVGFGVPAFAAISSPVHIKQIAPTPVVSVASPDWTTTSDDSTTSVSVTTSQASIPTISVAANTANRVEDISGNCDEAEHANDASCLGSGTADDDNSGSGGSNSGASNSGHGSEDSGSDDSGHGGGSDG